MSDKKPDPQIETVGMGRRRFINTAALAGLTAGVAACNDKPASAPAAAPGHTGDMRVLGLPRAAKSTAFLFRARRAGRLGHHQRIQESHGHQARWLAALHRG